MTSGLDINQAKASHCNGSTAWLAELLFTPFQATKFIDRL